MTTLIRAARPMCVYNACFCGFIDTITPSITYTITPSPPLLFRWPFLAGFAFTGYLMTKVALSVTG